MVFKKNINTGKNHPCEKPLDLLMKIIRASSNEDDVVLDCFSGSGSTALACIETGRRFIGCEKEKHYFDISQKRIVERLNVII